MEKSTDNHSINYTLFSTELNKPYRVNKVRVLIGRSEACDIVIPSKGVSAIHAVLEITETGIYVYDLNSKNGTHLNGDKIIREEISLGDLVVFGGSQFVFKKYNRNDYKKEKLQVLENLPPKISEKVILPEKSLPNTTTPQSLEKYSEVPVIQYPLSKDPKAEFSEYIFEDAEKIYPIFHYDGKFNSVEVIILHKDIVFSVDYLPATKGTFYLAGKGVKSDTLEYPYLGETERVPFVDVSNGEVFVNSLYGYEAKFIGSSKNKKVEQSTNLDKEEIVCFAKDNIQIYVRNTEAPPRVDSAPIFRRDEELKKYLMLVFLFILFFLGGVQLYEVDKKDEEEKRPERIAKILYRKKVYVSKNNAIEKTKNTPKQVVQKSPQKKINKEVKVVKEQKELTKKAKQAPTKVVGDKTSKKPQVVKKATPRKGPTNKFRSKVGKTGKNKGVKSSKVGSTTRSNRIRNSSKGKVDTYKSADFSSSLSSLMAKGGTTKSAVKNLGTTSAIGSSSIQGGEDTATLKRADVSKNVGSLVGATTGKLDTSKGVEGIVRKKNVYTAGIPYKTVVLGGVDPDTIRRILIDHLPQFRSCYQEELDKAKSSFDGVLVLNFVVGASGSVTRASARPQGRTVPGSVQNCVVNVLRGIPFPEPKGGGSYEVRQPLNFYEKRG